MFNNIKRRIKAWVELRRSFITWSLQSYLKTSGQGKKNKEELLRKQDLEKWLKESW